jgi:hypothetical protein
MTLLTAAECREKAYRKMADANDDRRLDLNLNATAEAWLALADQLERAEALGTFAKRIPGGVNNKPFERP